MVSTNISFQKISQKGAHSTTCINRTGHFPIMGMKQCRVLKPSRKPQWIFEKKITEVRKHLIIYLSSIWLTKSRQNFNWSIVFPIGFSSSSCLALTYCNPVKKVGTCQQVTENTMHEKSQNELILEAFLGRNFLSSMRDHRIHI